MNHGEANPSFDKGRHIRRHVNLRPRGSVGTRDDSLRGVLQHASERLLQHLDVAFARVWILNGKEGMLELKASAGIYTHLNGAHGRVPLGAFKVGRIAQTRTPHLTNAVIGDSQVGDQEWARREGMVAFAGHPLVVDDHVVGVLAMFSRHPLSEATLGTFSSVADAVALGIQRKQAEQLLRESEQRVRLLLASSGSGIYGIDLQGLCTFINRAAAEMLGGPPEFFLGRNMHDLAHHSHPDGSPYPVHDCPIFRAFKAGVPSRVSDEVFWRMDGTSFPLEYTSYPVLDGPEVRGAVITFMDISARKAAEKELHAAKEEAEAARLCLTIN